MRLTLSLSFFIFFPFCLYSSNTFQPTGLTVNFLQYPDQVFLNGYPVNTELCKAVGYNENFQFTEITPMQPLFGWIVPSEKNNTLQTAYQVMVASSFEKLQNDEADMWDTGKIQSKQSINIRYAGKQLQPDMVYFWKVKTWDNHQTESAYSSVRQFKTASELKCYYGEEYYGTSCYPLQKEDISPASITPLSENRTFVDFGKASFGRLRVQLYGQTNTDTVTIHLGEKLKNGAIDREPGGSIIYKQFRVPLSPGWKTYEIIIPPHQYSRMDRIIKMPVYIGEITPFRYCEIENYPGKWLEKDKIQQISVHYPFDDEASYFHSSDTILNAVWDICKNTVKATSFCGIFVDGNRERFPREADSYINQLSYYGVERGYSISRYTHEFQIGYSSQWTEWILQVVLMAWSDYMETGDPTSMQHFYPDLKAKTLLALAREDGLISTRTGLVTPDVIKSIHWHENEWKRQKKEHPAFRDIVDWPQKKGFGGVEGETDGFEFTDINTVVNAFHYRSLEIMAEIAKVLNKKEDADFFRERAELVKKSINKKLLDTKTGIYVDGEGSSHSSLHANILPLAFGIVPEKNTPKVIGFIKSRGLACSSYGANYLLNSLYLNDEAEYALQLLTATDERSWAHWIYDLGSTMCLEAWDLKYKPNLDWNHPWGTTPANIIPGKLMGIEPLEPGYGKIRIKPQPASLKSAEIKLTTIRGAVQVAFTSVPDHSFNLQVSIPANMQADVYLPLVSSKAKLIINGKPVDYKTDGNYALIKNIGSGTFNFKTDTD